MSPTPEELRQPPRWPSIEQQEALRDMDCTCPQTAAPTHLTPAEYEQDPFCPQHPDAEICLLALWDQQGLCDAAADRIEALEAAASVPPAAEDAMEVLAEDLRRVYAPVPDHILHGGEWWKVDQVVQSRTVFHGYACDKYEVTFPQGDVALNADRRRRVVVLVPLYDEFF